MKMIDESLRKLLAAEKECEDIIAEAHRKAEAIADKHRTAIINLEEKENEFLTRFQNKEKEKLENFLSEMQKFSEAKIKTICAEIDRKVELFSEKAVTEIERTILQ
ncbi:MAG: hypothetical protein J7L22_09285 [Candidatus Marinimicrobia bacterium]|nr:hypothetical protein [Candidatus Neomarinimicrobiota bacterium]